MVVLGCLLGDGSSFGAAGDDGDDLSRRDAEGRAALGRVDQREPPRGARADVDEAPSALQPLDDRIDRRGEAGGRARERLPATVASSSLISSTSSCVDRRSRSSCRLGGNLGDRLRTPVHGTSVVPVREGYNQVVLTTSGQTGTVPCGVPRDYDSADDEAEPGA